MRICVDDIEIAYDIDGPTLIVVGAQDPGTPPVMSEVMHARIPNSEMVVIDRAHHLSPVDQPEAFNAALLDFLGRHGQDGD